MIRAYVPSTLPQVIAWHAAALIPAGTGIHAATAALRALHPDADEEELEFLATKAAEEVSTVTAMTSGQRRATVAIDVATEQAQVVPGATTSMTLRADVPLRDWAAVFVDDLEWYAVDEVPHLL